MVKSDRQNLKAIVALAMTARLLTLIYGNPEFVGWFNHTYYYFVEVRGLIETGTLPYPDMPFLFAIYALVAKMLAAGGMGPDASIVAATRLVMVIVASSIPIPIYMIVKSINGPTSVSRNQWFAILSAGFLPLSLGHLPELLQKNMLGMLLLAFLLAFVQRLLKSATVKNGTVTVTLAIVIVLTHYGTFAAMILYAAALFAANLTINRDTRRALMSGAAFIGLGTISVGIIYLLDPQRFERLLFYASRSFAHSMVGSIFASGTSGSQKAISLIGVLIIGLLFYAAIRLYRSRMAAVPSEDRLFLLSTIVFCGLLVLPILDRDIAVRLGLFLAIPLIVVYLYIEKFGGQKPILKSAFSILMVVFLTVLAAAEVVSSKYHNAYNVQIYADIKTLQEEQLFSPNDLILAKTGAEHVANWFFRVKAGVITSLTESDFDKFDNIYVLNPIEDAQNFAEIENIIVENDADRKFVMHQNIPSPQNSERLFESEYLELFKVESPPDEWVFDDAGRWLGYRTLRDLN